MKQTKLCKQEFNNRKIEREVCFAIEVAIESEQEQIRNDAPTIAALQRQPQRTQHDRVSINLRLEREIHTKQFIHSVGQSEQADSSQLVCQQMMSELEDYKNL